MTTKYQAIARLPTVPWSKEAEMIESWVANKPTPDCRTCWHLHTSDHGDSRYECTSKSDCTNGDQYKPAPKVVLWRTEQ